MHRRLKKVLRIGGIVTGVVVGLLAAAALLILFDKPLVRNISQKFITKKGGFDVKIGKLDYTLFPLHVTLSAVTAVYNAPNYTMDVTVDRVEARGDLRKLLNGTKPAFETVEINIAELRFDQSKISEVPIDFASLIPQVGAILGYSARTSIVCRSMPIAVPGQKFQADDLALAFSQTSAIDSFGVRLDARRFAAAMTVGGQAVEAPLHADGTLTLAGTMVAALRLSLDSPRITTGARTESLKSLALETDGTWWIAENKVSLRKLVIDIPDLVTAAAAFDADFGKNGSFSADGNARIEKLEALAPRADPYLPPAFRGMRLRGRAEIKGKYSQPRRSEGKPAALEASVQLDKVGLEYEKNRVPFKLGVSGTFKAAVSAAAGLGIQSGKAASLHAVLEFNRAAIEYNGPGLPLKIELSGRLEAAGTYPGLRASADIHASLGPLAAGGASIKSSVLHLQAEGTKDAAEISRIAGSLGGLSLALPGGKKISFETVELTGAGRVDLAHQSAVLTGLEARFPVLAPVRLSGRFESAPGGARQARLESKDQKIPALRGLLAPFLPPALAQWEFDGSADVTLDAKAGPGPGAGWEFSGEVALSGAKFNDAAFTMASDGIDPVARIKGTYDPAKRDLVFAGSLELAKGESLWKNFYISWTKVPLKAEIAGRYDAAASGVEGLSASFVLPALGEVHASGSARLGPAPSFRIKAGGHLGIEPLYSLYSQSGAPPESRMRLGGDIAAEFDVNKDQGGMSIDGRVIVDGASAESPATKTSVLGMKAELPVHLRLVPAPGTGSAKKSAVPSSAENSGAAGAVNADEPTDRGSLQIKEIRTPSVTLQPPALVILGRTNAYRVEPFAIEVFGSRIEMGEISLDLDPAAGAFRGASSLKLADLDLSRLPAASPKFPLTGHVKVDLPELTISPEAITSKGQAEADIFGGKVIVRDIAVSNPLDKGRAISCNIDLLDLDLGKVTDIVPFGEVTGIVRGEVVGLTISYGQPESFAMRIESIPRKGVAQTFSLKAVDNLTVLSSGEKASGGSSQFWMRFIRGFRYAKMGIVSTLKNDTFTLNGTIHEGGVEYLVKKPALFGINVINRMPDKKVSFKEMMSRLERVGQSEPPTVTKKIR